MCVVFCLWNLENWFCFIYGICCKCQVVSIRFLLLLCGMRKLETMKPPPEIWHSRQRMISHDLRVNRIVDSERYRICFCMFFFHSFDHLLNSIKYSISLNHYRCSRLFYASSILKRFDIAKPTDQQTEEKNKQIQRMHEFMNDISEPRSCWIHAVTLRSTHKTFKTKENARNYFRNMINKYEPTMTG